MKNQNNKRARKQDRASSESSAPLEPQFILESYRSLLLFVFTETPPETHNVRSTSTYVPTYPARNPSAKTIDNERSPQVPITLMSFPIMIRMRMRSSIFLAVDLLAPNSSVKRIECVCVSIPNQFAFCFPALLLALFSSFLALRRRSLSHSTASLTTSSCHCRPDRGAYPRTLLALRMS